MKKTILGLLFILIASTGFAQTRVTTSTWGNASIVWSTVIDTPNDSASVWLEGRLTKLGYGTDILADTCGTVLNATSYTQLPATGMPLTNFVKLTSLRFKLTDISSNTTYSEYFDIGAADSKNLWFIYKKKTGPNSTNLWSYELFVYCLDPEAQYLR